MCHYIEKKNELKQFFPAEFRQNDEICKKKGHN